MMKPIVSAVCHLVIFKSIFYNHSKSARGERQIVFLCEREREREKRDKDRDETEAYL